VTSNWQSAAEPIRAHPRLPSSKPLFRAKGIVFSRD